MKLIITFLFLFILPLILNANEIYVICNKDLAIEKSEIKDIFLGKIRFSDSKKIKPADNKKANKSFLDKVLNLNKTKYLIHWEKKAFREGVLPPKKLNDDRSVIDYVSANKGAIGYVSSKPAGDVKVLINLK